jgi:hypothetical protein
MPEVDVLPDIAEVFDKARRSALGELKSPRTDPDRRHVIIVTPGRLLMFTPCPPRGSMPKDQVENMEKLLPSTARRNVAAIACTELHDLQTNLAKAIPFFGILLGLAYIGHAVWVFEGHPSALAAGVSGSNVLIVDGGMLPFLQPDWMVVVSGAMKFPSIYVHDRATYRLAKV